MKIGDIRQEEVGCEKAVEVEMINVYFMNVYKCYNENHYCIINSC
jgi:hypothetical protein